VAQVDPDKKLEVKQKEIANTEA
jgi:predicted  nucleic acid-binding Zn-ribbon protein